MQICVNKVGAELNNATFSLLRYISGISDRMARRIVTHRTASGSFPTRAALLSVPGLDENIFRQASGFLRVAGSEMPLDRSWIHPETYHVVEKMAASLNLGIADLVGNPEHAAAIKLEEFACDGIGAPTLELIRAELSAPGKDPRGTFTPPRFRAEIKDIADLKEGQILEGTVTNVTNFGAFVDIGIHQDGLVHLSQISNRFIRDPREAVKVGDLVQVKVISVEVETKRIGLSMKALLPSAARRRKRPSARAEKPRAVPIAAAAGGEITDATAEPTPAGMPAAPPHQTRREHPPRPRRRDGAQFRRHDPQEKREDGAGGRSNEPRARRDDYPARRPLPAPAQAEPEPKGPEPTMQEKIAILQNKFKGIN